MNVNPTFLNEVELRSRLRLQPGLIPVGIDADAGSITWADLSTWHCFEGFFHQSLAAFEAVRRRPAERFQTSTELLGHTGLIADLIKDTLAPSGFIFHAGRCGSTLLARILARCRAHAVLSEAAPHNQIWDVMAESPQESRLALYRNLIAATGRRRLAGHSALIIKFTSYNIRFFETIRAAFPNIPALFLFRRPDAILASYRREPPGWKCDDPVLAVEGFLRTAIAIRESGFRRLDYRNLTPANLPQVLEYFGLDPDQVSYRQMSEEFALNSKTTGPRAPFEPRAASPEIAPAVLQELYRELIELERQDWQQPLLP